MARSTPNSVSRGVLTRRRRAVDLRPGGLGQLDGRDADAACRRVDQHPLTGTQRTVAVQRRPRRGVVDRYRRALLEAQRVGQGDRVGRCDIDDFGIAAESRPAEDPFADACGVDAVADGLDGPRHLVSDDAGRLGCVRVEADARKVIGEVHTGGTDRDPHLARRWWRRVRPLLGLQDGDVTVLGDDDCAHDLAPFIRPFEAGVYPRRVPGSAVSAHRRWR